MRRASWRLPVLACALALTACRAPSQAEIDAYLSERGVHLASLSEKAASFKPLARDTIRGQALEGFLAERTAWLLNADEELDRGGLGTAVAITRDGYFLTAAHCLKEQGTVLAVQRAAGDVDWVRARVVWRGRDEDSGALDLALLKVDEALAAAFEWAAPGEVTRGAPLVMVGYGRQTSLKSGHPVYAAGIALASLAPPEPRGDGAPPTSIVLSNVPFIFGDSGGALATRAGHLVAVNTRLSSCVVPPGSGSATTERHWTESVRPDPSWLADRIAEDRRARARPFAWEAARGPIGTAVVEVDAALDAAGVRAAALSPAGDPELRGMIERGGATVRTTALAVARDGYFLAAAHAIRGGSLRILAPTGSVTTSRGAARVVWAGDVARGEPDLALLKVETTTATFEWAVPADVTPDAEVASATCDPGPAHPAFTRRFVHGRVRALVAAARSADDAPAVTRIDDDLPGADGEAGAPVFAGSGRFVGMRVRGHREFYETIRPDRAWIEARIVADRAHPDRAPRAPR